MPQDCANGLEETAAATDTQGFLERHRKREAQVRGRFVVLGFNLRHEAS